ncbi:hypothetical protein PUN28_020770 [Cardiocondyla obscurior]|uniref:Uncharacterized protein n=1 Tax=Cardiocondyla obscurior TaxID=286306 RepID=A0AAW2E773_9HYME
MTPLKIIEFINGMESPRIVGNNQQYKILKFFFNNGTGRSPRPLKVIAFNNETNFELLIRNHTQINNLGEYRSIQNFYDKRMKNTLLKCALWRAALHNKDYFDKDMHKGDRIKIIRLIQTIVSESRQVNLRRKDGFLGRG